MILPPHSTTMVHADSHIWLILPTKGTLFSIFFGFSRCFLKKHQKNLEGSIKVRTFANAIRELQTTLGYGVMVTLQILVLSFLVRVRVSQRRETSFRRCLFCFSKKTKNFGFSLTSSYLWTSSEGTHVRKKTKKFWFFAHFIVPLCKILRIIIFHGRNKEIITLHY